jgi:hypothetical protein
MFSKYLNLVDMKYKKVNRSNPNWSLKYKLFFIRITPSSEPSAHSSFPLLTLCLGKHLPHVHSSGLAHPATLQSKSDDSQTVND